MKPLTFRQWKRMASESYDFFKVECGCENDYCLECDEYGLIELRGIEIEESYFTKKMYAQFLLKDAQDLDAYIGNQSGTTLTAMGYGHLIGDQS